MYKIFLISGVSGAGKTTVMREVLKDSSLNLKFLPSYTTRQPRDTDVQGEYLFVTKDEFERKVWSDMLLEYEKVHGNYYGIDKKMFFEVLAKSNVAKDIDVRGALKFRSMYSDMSVLIFITSDFTTYPLWSLPIAIFT